MSQNVPAAFSGVSNGRVLHVTVRSPRGRQSTRFILRLWNKGKTKAQIAEATGLKVSTIHERIREHRATNGFFTPRHAPSEPLSIAQRMKLSALWLKGHGYADLAQVTRQSIKGISKRVAKYRVQHPAWFPMRSEVLASLPRVPAKG